LGFCRCDIYGNRWLHNLDNQRREAQMNDTTLQVGAAVIGLFLLAASYLVGTAVATQATIREAQRSAVIAGAARWSSNRETGEAQFDYVTCLKPEVK
jgi:hypothetical protein